MALVRNILNVLQHSDFDANKKHLNIAWSHENSLRKCLQAPSEGKGAWLTLFADSNDRVTFAYITKSLEMGDIRCWESDAPRADDIPVLETAVLRLSTPLSCTQQRWAGTQHDLLFPEVRGQVLCSGGETAIKAC